MALSRREKPIITKPDTDRMKRRERENDERAKQRLTQSMNNQDVLKKLPE